jgi:hypothetical protein
MAGDEAVARRVIQVDPRDFGLGGGVGESPKQRPFAAVLGCSDARVPIELIFNEGPNDLFVIRVAGNGLGSEVLGSLKYAVEHLGGSIKIVAVLGHSGCGAVSAAVDIFLDPRRYLELATSHSLRGMLDRILVVVQASAIRMLEIFGPDVVHYPGYRAALIEASIVVNAALAAYTVDKELKSQELTDIKAVYGVYVVESRRGLSLILTWRIAGRQCMSRNAWFVAKSEPKMRAETVLRKLHLQEALSENELNAYLTKIGPDGSLPPMEIPSLLELMMQRTEHISIEDIKAVSSLVGGNHPSAEKSGRIDEDHAMRGIVSRLTK